MVLMTNTGKTYTISSVTNPFSSNYTKIRIWIHNADINELRNVFSSQNETEILTVYNDDEEQSSNVFIGFTNLTMVKPIDEDCYFIVLKKPEE